VGEEALAAVGLEVLECAVGDVGAFGGQPRAPVARKGGLGLGRGWRWGDQLVAGSARGLACGVSATRGDASVRLRQYHAPAHALSGRVGGDAAAAGVVWQLLLDRLYARA
jgi:hypothetical protein